MGTDSPRVAVFDPYHPPTLALVQSLARVGTPFMVYHHDVAWPLRLSRYIKQVYCCPDICDYQRFPAWLGRQLEIGAFDMIAPTSDVVCYHIAEFRHQIPARYRTRLPTRKALLDVLFKDRLALACARYGISTPKTRAPTCLDEALEDADAIGYPVVIKPRSHVGNYQERGGRVDNPDQLRVAFGRYSFPARQQPLLAAHPQLVWPLLQEYVAHDNRQLSCCGLLDADGYLMAAAATLKIDQSPSATGIGTAFASYHDGDFINLCSQTVSQLLGRGLFEVEMLSPGGDGPPLVIDINARVFGQIGFDIARGNDLPKLWYASLSQRGRAQPQPQLNRAVVCLYPVPFLLANLTRIATGPGRMRWLARLCRLMWRTRHCIGWSWCDPFISLFMSLRPLRHPTTFIRSHIRERYHA